MRKLPPITYIRTVMKKPLQNTLHKGYNWLISLDLTTSKTNTFTDNSNAKSKNVYNHEEWNDHLFCDGKAVKHCQFFNGRIL